MNYTTAPNILSVEEYHEFKKIISKYHLFKKMLTEINATDLEITNLITAVNNLINEQLKNMKENLKNYEN